MFSGYLSFKQMVTECIIFQAMPGILPVLHTAKHHNYDPAYFTEKFFCGGLWQKCHTSQIICFFLNEKALTIGVNLMHLQSKLKL